MTSPERRRVETGHDPAVGGGASHSFMLQKGHQFFHINKTDATSSCSHQAPQQQTWNPSCSRAPAPRGLMKSFNAHWGVRRGGGGVHLWLETAE